MVLLQSNTVVFRRLLTYAKNQKIKASCNVRNKWTGVVYNHSQKPLYIIETDTGPACVHILGPKMKTPVGLDADGLKRVDGKSILGHKNWWKIIPLVSVDLYQIRSNFLLPVSWIRPVSDQQFGPYKIIENGNWGIEMAYVIGVTRDKNQKFVEYITDKYGVIDRDKGIALARQGNLDNVVTVNLRGKTYLRAKPNLVVDDNIG